MSIDCEIYSEYTYVYTELADINCIWKYIEVDERESEQIDLMTDRWLTGWKGQWISVRINFLIKILSSISRAKSQCRLICLQSIITCLEMRLATDDIVMI